MRVTCFLLVFAVLGPWLTLGGAVAMVKPARVCRKSLLLSPVQWVIDMATRDPSAIDDPRFWGAMCLIVGLAIDYLAILESMGRL